MRQEDFERRETTQKALEDIQKLREDARKAPEQKARRERIATAVLSSMIDKVTHGTDLGPDKAANLAVRAAVDFADMLIAELDRDAGLKEPEKQLDLAIPVDETMRPLTGIVRWGCCLNLLSEGHTPLCDGTPVVGPGNAREWEKKP